MFVAMVHSAVLPLRGEPAQTTRSSHDAGSVHCTRRNLLEMSCSGESHWAAPSVAGCPRRAGRLTVGHRHVVDAAAPSPPPLPVWTYNEGYHVWTRCTVG